MLTFDRHAVAAVSFSPNGGTDSVGRIHGSVRAHGEWVIAFCPEVPGANGQGRTEDEASRNLADAIKLIMEDRREDGLRGVPSDAVIRKVMVK
jgi:predicted RNase H-like HicB family nuclease